MNIFNSLDEIKNPEGNVIALGNFDGIHLGHQEIIKRAVKDGEGSDFKSSVFTFSNHPRNLLSKGEKVKNILFNDDKERIIKSLGMDYIYNIPFTEELMKMKPVDFIESILIEKMNMKEVICSLGPGLGACRPGTGRR